MEAPVTVGEAQAQIRAALSAIGSDELTASLNPEHRLEQLRGWLSLVAQLDAVVLDAVAELHGNGDAEAVTGCSLRTWLAQTNHLTVREAGQLIKSAELHRRFDRVADAQASGTISAGQARIVGTSLAELPSDLSVTEVDHAETTMIEFAQEFGPAELRTIGRHLVHVVAPEVADATDQERLEREHRHAVQHRSLSWSDDGHGSVHFRGRLPELDAKTLIGVIDAAAHHAHRNADLLRGADTEDGRPPSFAQRRADALLDLAAHAQTCRTAPAHGGDRPRLVVTITEQSLRQRLHSTTSTAGEHPVGGCLGSGASTAGERTLSGCLGSGASTSGERPVGGCLGSGVSVAGEHSVHGHRRHDDSGTDSGTGEQSPRQCLRPGVPAGTAGGHGSQTQDGSAIPLSVLRSLACDAELLPVVLGGRGQILDVGRAQRLVTPAIRVALTARDRGCVMPGCDQPPQHCEAHHVIPWQSGGVTALSNLALLCRSHHRLLEPQPNAPPGSRWEIRINDDCMPEVIPPEHVDPWRRARLHPRHRIPDAA